MNFATHSASAGCDSFVVPCQCCHALVGLTWFHENHMIQYRENPAVDESSHNEASEAAFCTPSNAESSQLLLPSKSDFCCGLFHQCFCLRCGYLNLFLRNCSKDRNTATTDILTEFPLSVQTLVILQSCIDEHNYARMKFQHFASMEMSQTSDMHASSLLSNSMCTTSATLEPRTSFKRPLSCDSSTSMNGKRRRRNSDGNFEELGHFSSSDFDSESNCDENQIECNNQNQFDFNIRNSDCNIQCHTLDRCCQVGEIEALYSISELLRDRYKLHSMTHRFFHPSSFNAQVLQSDLHLLVLLSNGEFEVSGCVGFLSSRG